MIAADTSTWIAFLHGADGNEVCLLDRALADQQVLMLPVVLTELLSDPNATSQVADLLAGLPLMEPDTGYWRRAGESRSRGLKRRRKARLGDALIAQICIDGDVALITRDRDFSAFEQAAGLQLRGAVTRS